MKREIKHEHLRSRLIPFRIDSTGGTPSITFGKDEFLAALTDNGAGDTTATFKEPFARTPVCVAMGNSTGGIGRVITCNSTTVRVANINGSGGGADGDIGGLVVGWDSTNTDVVTIASLLGSFANTFICAGQVTGADGTVTSGGADVVCTRVSQGVYTLTFKKGFGLPPIVFANARRTGSSYTTTNGAITGASVEIRTADDGAAVQDYDFNFMICGVSNTQAHVRRGEIVSSSQRKPVFLAFVITITAGVPAITVGGTDGSVTDNGVGDYTITFTRPFRRMISVVASTTSNVSCSIHTQSTTAVRIVGFDLSNNPTDPGSVFVMVLGSNDPGES